MSRAYRFEFGDRVRCVSGDTGITVGETYIIEDRFFDGRDEYVYLEGVGDSYLVKHFERAPTDLLGDALRRAAQGEAAKPTRKLYEPESFVGRTDIDWSKLIKDGGQS